MAATALVKIERSALAAASLQSSSRSLRSGRFSASTLRAKASPPAAGPSTISSIKPFFSASAAPIGSPLTIILTASSGPTARGSRCVPPAPGSRPSFTSGRPSLASLVATRKWQAERHFQSAAERGAVDCGDHRLRAVLDLGQHFAEAGGFGGLPNSVMSAPAMKVRPAQVSTIALTCRIGDRSLDAFQNAAADRSAQRIDRRAVDRDDGDGVMDRA